MRPGEHGPGGEDTDFDDDDAVGDPSEGPLAFLKQHKGVTAAAVLLLVIVLGFVLLGGGSDSGPGSGGGKPTAPSRSSTPSGSATAPPPKASDFVYRDGERVLFTRTVRLYAASKFPETLLVTQRPVGGVVDTTGVTYAVVLLKYDGESWVHAWDSDTPGPDATGHDVDDFLRSPVGQTGIALRTFSPAPGVTDVLITAKPSDAAGIDAGVLSYNGDTARLDWHGSLTGDAAVSITGRAGAQQLRTTAPLYAAGRSAPVRTGALTLSYSAGAVTVTGSDVPVLGITGTPSMYAFTVSDVDPDGPSAGKIMPEDQVLAVRGQQDVLLAVAVASHRPGDTVTLLVTDGTGAAHTVAVKLGYARVTDLRVGRFPSL